MQIAWLKLVCCILLGFALTVCPGCKTEMSEKEQLEYDNAAKSLQDIADETEKCGSDGDAYYRLRTKLNRLNYDFNPENMSKDDREKCQQLKDRIEAAKRDPDSFLQHKGNNGETQDVPTTTILSKIDINFDEPQRYPIYLHEGETVGLQLDCTGPVSVTIYDVGRETTVGRYQAEAQLKENIPVNAEGIYMLELKADNPSVHAALRLSSSGADNKRRPRIKEQLMKCKKNDFLATAVTEIIVNKVFREPKKVTLRANLKAMFSGKPRALISVTVPKGSDAILYSLRISTNENTVSSDGKFADNLKIASSRVKLFGFNVYEKQGLASTVISKLLFDTRPPRDEDAFCNLYVITNAAQAKRFQDKEMNRLRSDTTSTNRKSAHSRATEN